MNIGKYIEERDSSISNYSGYCWTKATGSSATLQNAAEITKLSSNNVDNRKSNLSNKIVVNFRIQKLSTPYKHL